MAAATGSESIGVDVPALLARLNARPQRITADSRQVRKGDAFAAFPGAKADGRNFIGDAMQRGAGAVLWDAQGFEWNPDWAVANQPVANLQLKLGVIADFIFGSPTQGMWVVGVTGTNGKTSCAQWIAQSLDRCGTRSAIVGTLGSGLVGNLESNENTTPDAARLHELLSSLRSAGAIAVAMEVSSHGLDQGRVNGVAFDVALFTNLTRDHLDYHGSMAAYGAAKAKLFHWRGLHARIINADDAFGQSLADDARTHGRKVLTYGLANADIAATALTTTERGIELSVATPWGRGDIATKLIGAFNASNLLGCLGVLLVSDVSLADALDALAEVDAPPGRIEQLGGDSQPLVIVDYAHTPDALEKVLTALRSAVARDGELVCVFGCGGERDPGKRPQMGRIAGERADRVVITSDNPRDEDPGEIVGAVVRGVRETVNRRWSVEPDRAAAILSAIAHAKPGDVVLIAGKGHETYQDAKGVRTHFSDVEVASAALSKWSAG